MKKTMLIIYDGLGMSNTIKGNAFKLAKTPTFDRLLSEYPNSLIKASGEFVGLPNGQMGNSEVGHLNIGAGQIVYTGLSLINQAIVKGDFSKNPVFIDVFDKCKDDNSTLHLIGLLSPGGVHSSEEHLFQLLNLAHKNNVKKVSVHVLGDGRDVKPKSIINSLKKLINRCEKFGYEIASIGGRFFCMDRDKNFDRVEKHFNAMQGIGINTFDNSIDYINSQYKENITDEFFEPAYNPNTNLIKNEDSIIFFNFRPDRARQLTHCFIGSDLYDFQPKKHIKIKNFISMMKYEGLKTNVAFEEMVINKPIGKVIEENNLSQLRIAETQKYAHVTYFMDGGKDIEYKNSKRIMVPSLKVKSYSEAPQMSAYEITEQILNNASSVDLSIINFANADMVGHTGDLNATIQAIEHLDNTLAKIIEFANKENITIFITADHGNSEVMLDENDMPSTKHTDNPVMLVCTDKNIKLSNGILANVAPTILDYMNIKPSIEMNCKSLIEMRREYKNEK
ncbi:2,3-bisphosphoglycerate-independent phosphoglycerate mutase [Mycoplasma sp. Mirounga ES2805-ORL]|uniref:2,3-bisphosphoglycerate-independent phosphoglycerate mutase n=1 Tax=Mycoplasma sp. Mirounga ES2805-ORL TaxID=754514 RepID=UPI00197B6332|nr:2,3-bisphosphoglycerate-independent phosphoglycerate mutase [Mycoplasma sp. Mirounga ES2805-ORL]QSF13391.1 2,3-bisphosphoglycerate-independent phosphoglycerate mutase [Mycoplasma sp. Mirounga ES2805-ORL]